MNAITMENYIVEDMMLDLEQFELEEAILELDSAIENQEQWYADVNRILIFGLAPNLKDLSIDAHHLCAFGAWLDVYGNEKIRQQPIFEKIIHNHELLHKLASELLIKVMQGEKINTIEYDALSKVEKKLRHRLYDLHGFLREKASNIDSLTGLYNRKEMFDQLTRQHEFVNRGIYDVSLALVDVDHFKAINDTYGHLAGDKMLSELGRYLSQGVRAYDSVFRYGGDEFLILLPDTKTVEAHEVLSRLHSDISTFEVVLNNGLPVSTTTSFGIATLKPGDDIERTIHLADQALYEAKREGRNLLKIAGTH